MRRLFRLFLLARLLIKYVFETCEQLMYLNLCQLVAIFWEHGYVCNDTTLAFEK